MRKKLWIQAVIGMVATFLAPSACADPGELEEGALIILAGRDASVNDQRQKLIDQWNELHPHNQARIKELSELADHQRSQMVAQAQSGQDDVDIYVLDVTWTPEFAENDYILPLESDTTGFLEKPLETCRYDDELWALPFNSDAGLLYYRSDLISEPPRSWHEIEENIAEVLDGPPENRPGLAGGYAGQLADYEGLTVNAIEAIWSEGAEVVDRNGDVVIDNFRDEAREALGRLRLDSNLRILPDSLEYNETESMKSFDERKVLVMRNWPVAYDNLRHPTSEGAPGPAVEFDVTKLPGPSALGGQNLAIAANTAKPKAAQALIEFLTDARSQQILFERGGFAATREIVYHDAEIQRNHPYALTLLEAIKSAELRPETPYYTRFSEVFRNGVIQTRKGGDLPEDFADQLRDALQGR